jgi:hypothetical protein
LVGVVHPFRRVGASFSIPFADCQPADGSAKSWAVIEKIINPSLLAILGCPSVQRSVMDHQLLGASDPDASASLNTRW